jgi:hypothetical protein
MRVWLSTGDVRVWLSTGDVCVWLSTGDVTASSEEAMNFRLL